MSRMGAFWGRVLAVIVLVCTRVALPSEVHAQDDYLRGPVVRSLSFSGNRSIDDLTLRISIGTSQSSTFARWGIFRWLGMGEKRYFDETEFRRDSARVVLLYQRSGFREVEVDMDARYTGDDVHLRFFIDEGEPVRLDTLEIFGLADIADESDVLGRLPLRVGDPFNLLLVQASQDSIGAYLRNRGYPFAEIYPNYNTNLEDYSATLRFTADPGPRARVASVTVHGAQDVDEDVIRRAMSIKEGDWYSAEDLYESQIDLYRMNLFNLVDVGLADTTDMTAPDTVVAIQVNVAEAALHQVRFGPGYGTIDCFRALGAWTAYDFLGGGRTFDISARVSKIGATGALHDNLCRALKDEPSDRQSLNYSITANLTEPFIFSRNMSASLSFTAGRYSEVQAFLRRSIGGDMSLTWRTPIDIPVTVSYGLSRAKTEADDAVFCFFLNVCDPDDAQVYTKWLLRSEVGLRFAWDRSNSPIDPTRGFRLTGDVRHASEDIGSDALVQFTRGTVEFASYHPVARRSVFSWRLRLAAVGSPRSDGFLTPDDRLYGGGPYSVRGYSPNELGPIVRVIDEAFTFTPLPDADSAEIVADSIQFVANLLALDTNDVAASPIRRSATGGNRLFFANAEYRFPLPVFAGRVFGAAFIDAGMVFDSREPSGEIFDTRQERFRITPGFGFRFVSPLGPMRVDIGYNPYPPPKTEWYGEMFYEPTDSYELYRLPELSGDAPQRNFLDRFRLHFSVGQAF